MALRRYPTEEKTISTRYGDVECVLSRSPRRRTMEIQIQENGTVRIRIPRSVSERDIQSFVESRYDWIKQHSLKYKRTFSLIRHKIYDDGQAFLFLGKKYMLRVLEGDVKRTRIDFREPQGWRVIVQEGLSLEERRSRVQKKLFQWYKEQAKEFFAVRTLEYGRRMNDLPEDIVVKTQRRIWGSCDARRRVIYLNWHLIMSPVDVIDYVIVHELAHLKVQNHSARFWKRVAQFYPDYDDQRNWLKNNVLDMALPDGKR